MKTNIGSTTFEVIDGVIHGHGTNLIPYPEYPCSTEEEFENSVNFIYAFCW